MPDFPIIDSHVHFYDKSALSYPWLGSVPRIDNSYLPAQFDAARGAIIVEKLVFVEVDIASGRNLDEALFVSALARQDTRIGAIVASAPLERGAAVQQEIEQLRAIPELRGIRRIRNFQLASAVELVRQCPDVRFILDHIAKPSIAEGAWEPWASDLRAMAALPNVVCKMAGVTTEADHGSWTGATIRPYIDHAIASFGWSRLMFGSDWPVVNLASSYQQWIAVLDDLLAAASVDERADFYRNTAARTYRLS